MRPVAAVRRVRQVLGEQHVLAVRFGAQRPRRLGGVERDVRLQRLAQAVAELAHVIAANEAMVPDRVAELLPHAERLRRFAAAAPPAGGKLR